jgi:hypothetical protein
MFPYKEVAGGRGVTTIVALNPNTMKTEIITGFHPSFKEIKEGLDNEDPNVWGFFDVAGGIMLKFQAITDRVSYDGRNILWDGQPVNSTIATQLQRALESGESNYAALALFWEKLESNPEPHSREQAYDFLASHDFHITVNGDLVAYKGVQSDGKGGWRSGRRSEKPGVPSAYVDGVPVPELSYVPNNIGTVVSMPRNEVVHDPTLTCSRGLHISTHSYAQSWGRGGAVVEVHANPRDICSVPDHSNGEKVRVNQYEVVAVREHAHDARTPVLAGSVSGGSYIGYDGV